MNAFFSRFLLLLLAAPLATGCLSSRYHVDDAELARLAQLPPERRCDAIRATQELSLRRSRAPRERVYVDPASTVIGDVTLGDDCSLWPGAVVRGDMHRIRVGARTSIQD
ncbi:MAG TPA: hypothetical protein RMG45_17120, partial [Polyangiaceae bacterium LLY-WYZ-15_(1-7)]|nr:hypothetical protein [Polyangiaceae bacterium LLY-WYZ-15_(1-7)]